MIDLNKFLSKLFKYFINNNIDFLILRNYKNLPDKNDGHDIDFLVEKKSIPIIDKILKEINNITITNKIERTYVINYFIYGINDNSRSTFSIQIDFYFKFSWKGFDYLSVKKVLQKKMYYKNFYIPHPVHEAIISLFSSFIIGGFIKEKYFNFIQSIFKDSQYTGVVQEYLSEFFDKKFIDKLVSDIVFDRKEKYLKDIWQSRFEIMKNNFKKYTIRTIIHSFVVHHITELKIRCQKTKIIVILGPDGSGKSTIINIIYQHLKNIVKEVEVCHLRCNIFLKNNSNQSVTNPHEKPPKGLLLSLLQLVYWVVFHNLSLTIKRPRNSRVVFFDRYFHDLFIDPRRYRYGGPSWFVKLMSLLIKRPDIFICIDVPPNVIQERKNEVNYEETVRQMTEYKIFIKKVKRGYLVNGNREKKEVANEIENIIVNYFSRQVNLNN